MKEDENKNIDENTSEPGIDSSKTSLIDSHNNDSESEITFTEENVSESSDLSEKIITHEENIQTVEDTDDEESLVISNMASDKEEIEESSSEESILLENDTQIVGDTIEEAVTVSEEEELIEAIETSNQENDLEEIEKVVDDASIQEDSSMTTPEVAENQETTIKTQELNEEEVHTKSEVGTESEVTANSDLTEKTKLKDSEKEKKIVQKSQFPKLDADTFIGQVGELKIFQKAESEPESRQASHEEIFIDPSKPLKQQSKALPSSITEEEIKIQLNILKNEGVIVVSCLDEKIAYDTATQLAFQFDTDQYDFRKILAGRGENSERFVIDTFLNETIGKGEYTVVVIDIKSSLFFNSMLSSDYAFSSHVKDILKERNIFLILSISSELWIEDIQQRGKLFYFKVWNIGLDHKLELTTEKKDKIQSLIPDKESLKKIILYTITFFPGLNQEDFEQIVQILLFATKIKEKKRAKLKNNWLERPDYYLMKCEVVKTYSENYDSDIIDFKETSQRIVLKQHFDTNQSFYIRQKFEALFESGLLFSLGTNQQVINNLINLIVKKLSSNTKDYSIRYLHQLTKGILDTSSLTFSSNSPSFEEIINKFYEVNDKLIFLDNSLSILAQLIDEMLSNDKLRGAVNSYLNVYMDRKRREVVQRLMENLRYSPNFDKFYWVGRLLNEGDKATRDKGYNFLISLSKQMNVRVFDLLEKITTWLPHPETPIINFSPVNMYGLTFIIDFTNDITKNFPVSKFGYFPSKYTLFVTFDKDENTKEKIRLLISWLFHSSLESALIELRKIHTENQRTNTKRVRQEVLRFRAHIIEVWYAILNWNAKDDSEDDRESLDFITEQLLIEVVHHTSENIRTSLDRIWESKALYYAKLSNDYLKKISKSKNPNSPERKKLIENRTLINKSFSMLNQLREHYKKLVIRKKLNIAL